jgi:hypothetical protein
MDFLDPKKKRATRIRLYIGYALVGIALVIGTILLVFEAKGFDVDRSTGQVIQNGLVYVDAHPESARVIVNGENKGNTDTRLVIPEGSYDLRLERDGYRTWQHHFELEGSSIERFIYPFMFPTKLKSSDIQLFSAAPSFATESLDRKWVVVLQPGSLSTFNVFDISNKTVPSTSIALTDAQITTAGTKHQFELVEWSTDNRHFIVKHTFDTGVEYILVDREAAATSINLNKHFARPLVNVTLRDKKFNQLYLLDSIGGTLVSANLDTKAVAIVANKVLNFRPHGGDIVLYVSAEGASATKNLVRIRDGDQTYNLRSLPADQLYLLDIARFDGDWYMVVGAAAEKKAYVYINAFDALKASKPRVPLPSALLKLDVPLEYASFSANTRFMSVQGGSQFAVYDAETQRQYRFDSKLQLPPNQKVTWMDGHRFTVVSEGKLRVFDFDGTNMQTLNQAELGFIPFFDRDFKLLYTISPSVSVKNRTALTSTIINLSQ